MAATMDSDSPAIPPHLAPRQGELVLFPNNSLLEAMSRIRPSTVLAIFVPVAIGCFVAGLLSGIPWAEALWLLAAGILSWTLFEYVFHRFVFHFQPKSPLQSRLQFLMLGVHHQYPQDRDRLVMPVTVSIPLALLLLIVFQVLMGNSAWCFFSGFAAGYIAYDMMHYAIHHAGGFEGRLLRAIRQHHLAHHFRDTRRGFGVSTPLWDRVFRS